MKKLFTSLCLIFSLVNFVSAESKVDGERNGNFKNITVENDLTTTGNFTINGPAANGCNVFKCWADTGDTAVFHNLGVGNDLTITGNIFGSGLNVAPNFPAGLICPTLIGGTTTTSDLNLKTTSGVGATGADMHFLVGNNGATEAMTVLNSGYVGVGTTAPSCALEIVGNVDSDGFVIGANSLTTSEWAYLDGQNQAVKSGSSPSFVGETLSGDLAVNGGDITSSSTTLNLQANSTNILVLSSVATNSLTVPVPASTGNGNALSLNASAGITQGVGGAVGITAGNGASSTPFLAGGAVILTSGTGTAYQGTPGGSAIITLSGGTGSLQGCCIGGDITLQAGNGSGSNYASRAGNIYLTPGVNTSGPTGSVVVSSALSAGAITSSVADGVGGGDSTYVSTFVTANVTTPATAAAGFGGTCLVNLEDRSGNTPQFAGSIDTIWTTATHGSEAADIVFNTARATSSTEQARITSNGLITMNVGSTSTDSDILISIRTPIVNFKTVANTNILTVPTGYYFLLDRMEIVTTINTGPLVAPTVQFGSTADADAYYGPTLTTSNSVYSRHVVNTPLDGITAGTTILAGVTIASTATTHSGYFRIIGSLVRSAD